MINMVTIPAKHPCACIATVRTLTRRQQLKETTGWAYSLTEQGCVFLQNYNPAWMQLMTG